MSAYQYARHNMGMKEPRFGYRTADVNVFLSSCSKELRDDIRQSREGGNLVGFIAGPPCPDFSIAGKQKGRNGDNGKLSLSYISLIIAQKPDFFLFENVKGLWRTAKHREYYDELKESLSNAGYVMTDRLCNAIEFGVPQDRDRILLFGIRKSVAKKRGLDIKNFDWTKHILYDVEEIKKMEWSKPEPFKVDSATECPTNIPKELTVQYLFEKNDVEHYSRAEFVGSVHRIFPLIYQYKHYSI